ncbi:MAG: extracellular solute-binding protein [Chloroflexi bacterium]|nr:extracellular solute-binding protein [Chloroflexota bacterium]
MNRWLALMLVLVTLVAIGCAVPAAPVAAPQEKAAAPKTSAKADWETKWESTLAEAKKEGSVSVYSTFMADQRVLLSQAFKARFGIELDFSPFARGAEIQAKVEAERRAGLYLADAFGVGTTTLIATMKPAGLLGPVEPLLMLPEVKDPKAWRREQFPFMDKDRYVIVFIAGLQRYLAYNTDMIKEGEITTYKDVLKPQFKGKITLNDPTVTGAGNAMMGHLARDLWTPEEAGDFLRRLIKDQEANIQRDKRLHVEQVARGKYPVGVGTTPDGVAEFLEVGAPIASVKLKEGYKTSSSGGSIAVPTRMAHPNAGLVFLNWLLTNEGQRLAARGFGMPSLRLDVPTEGIHPLFIPEPTDKIFLDSEEDIIFRGQMLDVAKKIIDEATRK